MITGLSAAFAAFGMGVATHCAMQEPNQPSHPPLTATPQDSQPQPQNTGQSPNYFNPQMAIVFDFRARLSDSDPDSRHMGLGEMELNFFAPVDPFLTAFATVALAREDGETKTDVEEAYAQYTGLGHGLDLRIGKIKGAIGRTNRNHADQLEYLEQPLVLQDFLGEEGLKAPGGSIAYLFPGDRFKELSLDILDLEEDGPLFAATRTDRPLAIGHARTFFDFSEDLSAQLGFTYALGPNGPDSGHATMYGADCTMKWQPGKRGKSAMFEAEAYWADTGIPGANRKPFGAFAAFTYQVMPNWHATVKADYGEIPGTNNIHRAIGLGMTYKMSEFSHVRFEWARITSNFESDRDMLTFQLQYLIGVHPAHKY